MIELLPSAQRAELACSYPTFVERDATDGGHMAYRRFHLHEPSTDQALFIKSHDPSLLTEQWRRDEMLHFLKKEARIYEHLKGQAYANIPEAVEFREEMLILSGLHETNGWYWRAPKESQDFRLYTEDVLEALENLESVRPHESQEKDEISLDVFYDNGWDKLHDIDVEELITINLQRWEKHLHKETFSLARQFIDNIGDLLIKRVSVVPMVFNHHDARQANIAWHPEYGVKIVDWSWADMGLTAGDKTMFLLDLHKAGHKVEEFSNHINVDYAKLVLGYWLGRSGTKHMEGNDIVRMQQFVSAMKASELLLRF